MFFDTLNKVKADGNYNIIFLEPKCDSRELSPVACIPSGGMSR